MTSPESPDVSVCVPVYQAHDDPNVATIQSQLDLALGDLKGELVVALNGIDAAAVGAHPDSRTVQLPVNRGVAPGWNAAAAASTAEVLVFANDDVKLGPGSLAMLHDALVNHPEAGIVGPVGSRFDFRTGRHIAWVSDETSVPGEILACDVVAGFLFALRRSDFEAVGGFDEAYAPAIMEEIDLTLAVREHLGLGAFMVSGVDHEHEFGVSSAPIWRMIRHNGRRELLVSIHRRNRRHFYRKWAGRL